MTVIAIIVCIVVLLAFLSVAFILSWLSYNFFFQKKEDKFGSQLSTLDIFLILVSIGLIFFSLTAPFIFTRGSVSTDFNFTQTGQIGDTVGGLMSPFINLSAVIVTGLAFYMQYRANKLQVKIFKEDVSTTQEQFRTEQEKQDKNHQKQQFESQFYEMLRLHKENVNEIEIDAKKRITHEEKVIKSFASSSDEPDFRISYTYKDYTVTKRNAFVEMLKELEFMIKKLKVSDTPELNFTSFQKIYEIYFWGLTGYESLAEKFTDESSKKFEDILFNIQEGQYSTDLLSFNQDIPINIPAFKGHSNFLGHYYRHLFHMVKFVADYDESIVKKDEKVNYLRLLRAQLSNHEQALLFYNWLAKYGGAWQDDRNNFLTEYRMIHNLWYGDLPKETFVMKKLKELVAKYKELGYTDDLFEMGDSDIINS